MTLYATQCHDNQTLVGQYANKTFYIAILKVPPRPVPKLAHMKVQSNPSLIQINCFNFRQSIKVLWSPIPTSHFCQVIMYFFVMARVANYPQEIASRTQNFGGSDNLYAASRVSYYI